ncbi:hypothetical protein ABIA39_006543 [Nocardia sp. GAS34]|uniref:hypothetical protein n=1 Tax=unclassified Nocardia TaxID=2637762 RepID=UPI003D24A98C
MSNPLSNNTSSDPVAAARAMIGAQLDHYHRMTSLHHALITVLNEADEDRLARGEFLRATARDIATSARTTGLDEAARVAVNEALSFYPRAYRDEWLAQDRRGLRSEWEALSAATAQIVTAPDAFAPGIDGQSVTATARALQKRLFELYDIENAPDVVHTEDGPEYVLLDSEPDPQLTASIAKVEKQLDDYLRTHRDEPELAEEFASYYAGQDRHLARLLSTPPDLREHIVSIGKDDANALSPRWQTSPQLKTPDLPSAYIWAIQTMVRYATPDQRVWLDISREIAEPGGTVTVESVHHLNRTAGEVVRQIGTLSERRTESEHGEIEAVQVNRLRLRARDPQTHPDREVWVGWDRLTDSFFAQVFDGVDADGEDVVTLDVGANARSEITDPRQVIAMIRPYAPIPPDLEARLTGQRAPEMPEIGEEFVPTHIEYQQAQDGTTVWDGHVHGIRIVRLLDAVTRSEHPPSASSGPSDSPDPDQPDSTVGIHEPPSALGHELG